MNLEQQITDLDKLFKSIILDLEVKSENAPSAEIKRMLLGNRDELQRIHKNLDILPRLLELYKFADTL